MKLNWVETLLMNNPVRAWIQRRYEAPALGRMAPKPTRGATALILGCGRGVDIEVAFEILQVGTATAIDLDPKQVDRAARRVGKRYGYKLTLRVGDAEKTDFEDASFDLVLDFGIIHHIPDWRAAVREVHRVLKPGGQFLYEEVPKKQLDRWLYRTFAVHPEHDRFEPEDFGAAIAEAGLTNTHDPEIFVGGFFRGAAVKP